MPLARAPHTAGRRVRILVLLFTLSGAAGLVQEVAWSRVLAQHLGGSFQTLAIVLAAFLGGLALGGSAGARAAGRSRNPLRGYGRLEIVLAALGLLAPAVAVLLPRVLAAVGPSCGAGAALLLLRGGLAMAILVPPSFAMGATLPFVVRAARLGGAPGGPAVALLYGANTLGGSAGACAASFAMLPLLGTRLTFVAAALLNGAAGLTALALARRRVSPGPAGDAALVDNPAPAGDPALGRRPPPEPPLSSLTAAAFVSGACGSVLQIGWIRLAAVSFGSSVYALGLTLTVFILGLGAGPLLVHRRLERLERGRLIAAVAAAVAGSSALAILPALGSMPIAAAWVAGRYGDHPLLLVAAQFALMALLLLLPATAQGAVLPALAAAAQHRGAESHAAAGRLYAASTWGAVAGYLAAGFVALPLLGTRLSLAAGACAAAFLGALLLLAERRRAAGALVAAVAGCAAALLPGWDRQVLSGGGFLYGAVYRSASPAPADVASLMRRRGALLYDRDSGDGLVTVRRSPAGILSLQINGKTEASTGGDMPTQILVADLPILLHPQPRAALVIGLASGVSAGAVLAYPIDAVDVIEIAPAVVDAVRLFAGANGAALDDPRLRVIVDDARARLLVRGRLYDVIVSQPTNPWVAGVANLFTVEFYRLLRARLAPGGLACQWLQAYRLAPADFRAIVRTFIAVFPDATLWEESPGGGDYFLVGGDRPIRPDPARLRRAADSPAWDHLRRVGIAEPADLLARFVAGPDSLRTLSRRAALHTDDRLFLETRAPLALFRDSPREAIAALGRVAEPVATILPAGVAEADPALAAALAVRMRLRRERIETAAGLKDADLWSLRDPYLAAGLDHLRMARPVEAVQVLVEATRRAPQSGSAHFLLAEAYRAAGLGEAAVIALRAAVRADPSLAPAWNALGLRLAEEGRPGEARAAFERALEADPGLATARNNLGSMLLRQDDRDGAEAALRAALDTDPLLAPAWANLGLVRKLRGDARGAESNYRRALALDPLNLDARYNLARLLAATHREREAATELRRLLAIDPADVEAERVLRSLP